MEIDDRTQKALNYFTALMKEKMENMKILDRFLEKKYKPFFKNTITIKKPPRYTGADKFPVC